MTLRAATPLRHAQRMGRSPRYDSDGAWHHLMNRGADRQDIYSTDDDRCFFEYQMGDLVRRGLFEIHAYALMDNHFHVLGRSPNGALSVAMHRLGCEYARWYNHRHDRDGPLFRNRFVSVPVTDDAQLVVASRYVHRNPLAIVPSGSLVAYRWSSLGVYLGRREGPDWLERNVLDGLIGDADAHRALVESSHPSDVEHDRWAPFRLAIEVGDVERAVTTVTGSDLRALVEGSPRRSDALTLLLVVAVELRVSTAERLAARYRLPSASAVRTAARRGRVWIADDPHWARLRERAVSMLVGGSDPNCHV